MNNNEEKLRLLFIEQDNFEERHSAEIHQGAAAILQRWPSYATSVIWCIVFIISFATLVLLIIFMALLNQERIYDQKIVFPKKGGLSTSQDIQSEFCSQMTAKQHKKRQEIPERDLELFDSGNNIFYLIINELDKLSSCSVESVVRHCPDKNIFLISLKSGKNYVYENKLKSNYSNFNLLNINGKKIVRGSPFEGKWVADERSLFQVALLTVWQFGGTALSENLLLLNRKMFDSLSVDCKVGRELIFCPIQCAAYLYELIGVTLRSGQNTSIDLLLDSSVKEFCGAEHLMKTGCTGVTRIDEGEMCEQPDSSSCMFVRTKVWLSNSTEEIPWQSIQDYCPITWLLQKDLENESTTYMEKSFKKTTTEHQSSQTTKRQSS